MTSANAQRRWLYELKRLPSSKEVAADAFITGDPVLAGAMDALMNGRAMPAAEAMTCTWDAWRAALDSVLAGSMTPEYGAAQAQSRADECMVEMGIIPTPTY